MLFFGAAGCPGAILYLEDFNSGIAGWVDRDAGEMVVSHNAGNYLQGSFGATFLPQTDAFRANSGSSGGAFTGDYVTPGITQIRFDFYAVNVLPSDLFIRIIDGANIFSYQFNPINVGSWETFTVNLAWSYGWLGLSEAAFNAALASVDMVDIQVSRSGSGAQSYYLDNVQTLDTDIGDPGGPDSAIPEPTTVSLFMVVGALLFYARRRTIGNPSYQQP
jgi:hypothetical protein